MFDANLKYNLMMFWVSGPGLAAMFLEDIINLDATTGTVKCVLLLTVHVSCPACLLACIAQNSYHWEVSHASHKSLSDGSPERMKRQSSTCNAIPPFG